MTSSTSGSRHLRGLPIADPEAVGFSPARLARLRPAMQRYVDSRYVPGVVSLIARHGRIAYLDAVGWLDVERAVPVAADSIFRIASMTKPVASVALLMLYEEENFLLDEPISPYLPAFRDPVVSVGGTRVVPAHREISFRDCLTHTTGVSGQLYWANRNLAAPPGDPSRPATVREAVEKVARTPLGAHPGTVWEYGPGHDIAGTLVEVISGKNLDEFMRERIFAPLGMDDTSFYLPEEKLARFTAAYIVNPADEGRIRLLERPEASEKVLGPRTYCSGGGGLLSTVADYARFAQMLLGGGILDGQRLLSRKTVELMTTNQIGDLPVSLRGPGYGYGLGVYVRKDLSGNPLIGSVGSFGWGGAYCTWYFADPKEDLFGLLFTQVLDYTANPHLTIRAMFEKLTYQAIDD